MAFGIKRQELETWKRQVMAGESIAFITHFWLHPRYSTIKTITKAGSANLVLLTEWGEKYGLKPEWIHHRDLYPHFDLLGEKQLDILLQEGIVDQIERFQLK